MADKKKIALTGDRPTGKLHLGHYVGSIKNRIKLQDEYKQYVMVADVQALTDNADNPLKVRTNILETTIDNIAAGVDPNKTTFFIQSMVPEIAELTVFFLNLVTVARLTQNPTVRAEMREKGYGLDQTHQTQNFRKQEALLPDAFGSKASGPVFGQSESSSGPRETPGELAERANVPAGFLCYPVSQAADILFCKADVVPVGEDQKPMIEQTNEIVDKFNTLYGEVFPRVQQLIPATADQARLVGIDGKAKMSKSLNNCIYLADSSKNIEDKVMQMYTDPDHVHVEQPGKVEGNVVFQFLDIFDTEVAKLSELKVEYQQGGLGDVVIKKRLIGILQEVIAPIREQREYLAKNPDHVMDILKAGTEQAREVAARTLAEVKKAMHIDYF